MPEHPFESEAVSKVTESPRKALGCFLRKRRESITPEEVNLSSRRGRRTPGLRREEVAFLADIGVKWYARLEAGDEVHPSESTLSGIAVALRLSSAEFEYTLDLAGLRHPLRSGAELTTAIPEPIAAMLSSVRGVAITANDRILTPLRWNGLADLIYGHTRFNHPVERNALVRCLFDPDFIEFLGADREELLLRAVGMFRLNYSSTRPSPFADAVYARVKDDPLFQRAWNRRVVAGEIGDQTLMVRSHRLVGRIAVYSIDFSSPMRPDLLLHALVPGDEETAAKFNHLERVQKQRRQSNDRGEERPRRLTVSIA